MKIEYWYEMIATLELKEFITSSEDSSLMATKQQQYIQIPQVGVRNELECFYCKLNSSYMLLILLSMSIMGLIIQNSSFRFKGNDRACHIQRAK